MAARAGAPEQVADRLHSAAVTLLRRLRREDAGLAIGPARTSTLAVLVFGGPKTMGELAAIEQVRPPTMSRIVAALAEPVSDREFPHVTAHGARRPEAQRQPHVPTQPGPLVGVPRAPVVQERRHADADQAPQLVAHEHAVFENEPHHARPGELVD